MYDRVSQRNHKETVGYGKKVRNKRFQDMDPGEIQEVTDTMPDELIEDYVMEISASEPVQTRQ